jgi:hypothetical protein
MTRNTDERRSRVRAASASPAPPTGTQRRGTVAKKSELESYMERFVANELTEEDKKQESLECVDERFFVSLKDALKLQFFGAIGDNATLKTLKLVRKELTDAHAQVLADSLKKNSSIEEVNLEGNKLTTRGMQSLIEALHDNHTIKKMFLRNQSNGAFLSSAGETVLVGVLDTNTAIIKLGVEIRGMQTTRKLEQTLQKNTKK